ncbi:sulfate ABC transporter substrate-binding protein [Camelimonas abortus]|uniref:Sulfate ABC transporter substrate-binding protein n=1 Tax=Camelimonas abortus TaxID=1017184 RepID=A0ABV7LBG7_9HYPH
MALAGVAAAGLAGAASLVTGMPREALAAETLLNVSYDPTRELYRDLNAAFAAAYEKETGEKVQVRTSHGGSGSQARTVIDGAPADVVTLGIPSDIDAIARLTGKIPADWRARLPNNSLPYTSTVVFVVRKGNPKNIRDWDDLVREDVGVITPNPKTSAGGRWNFLGAWGYAAQKFGGDEAKIRDFVGALYRNVKSLDTGARGSTITFAQRKFGDVMPAWENEAHLIINEFGKDQFDIVAPPTSILAEPPVALVEGNVDRRGTRKVAEAYLKFLYSPEAQRIIARHHYRPSDLSALDPQDRPVDVKMFRIEDLLGNWDVIQKTYFDNGGVFDQLTARK